MRGNLELVEHLIDQQITEILKEVEGTWLLDSERNAIITLIRAAYGKALLNALIDPEGSKRLLERANYKIPYGASKHYIKE